MISWLIVQNILCSLFILTLVVSRHKLNQLLGAHNVYMLWLTIPFTLAVSVWLSAFPVSQPSAISPLLIYAGETVNQVQHSVSAAQLPWLMMLWLTPAIAFLGLVISHYIRYRTSLGLYPASEISSELPLAVTQCQVSPQLLGLLRPRIVIPATFTSQFNFQQQRLILAHEHVHWQQRDPVWNLLAVLILSLFWFNPIFWVAYRHFRQQQELSCDSKVLADESLANRRQYGYALIQVSAQVDTCSFTQLNYSEKTTMKQRIQHLVSHSHKPRSLLPSLAAVALCCSMMGVSQLSLAKPDDSKVRPVHREEPLYPKQAAEQNVSGWVELGFSIETDGSVSDIEVLNAEPKNVFERNSISALANWRYSQPERKLTDMRVVLAYELGPTNEQQLSQNNQEVVGVSRQHKK